MDGVPVGELAEHGLDLRIERAVGALDDVEQEVAILADVIHEHVDDPAHRAELPIAVVEPVANRGVGLPGIGVDLRHDAALEVLDPAASGFLFAVVDGFDLAGVAGGILVGEVGDHGQLFAVVGGLSLGGMAGGILVVQVGDHA